VEAKTRLIPADFEKQKKDLTEQVLKRKAWIGLRSIPIGPGRAPEARKESWKLMPEKLKGFGDLT